MRITAPAGWLAASVRKSRIQLLVKLRTGDRLFDLAKHWTQCVLATNAGDNLWGSVEKNMFADPASVLLGMTLLQALFCQVFPRRACGLHGGTAGELLGRVVTPEPSKEACAEIVRDARADWADSDSVIPGRHCKLMHDIAFVAESHADTWIGKLSASICGSVYIVSKTAAAFLFFL